MGLSVGTGVANGARFEFATAGRILFGCGVSAELSSLVAARGRRVLLVTRAGPVLADRVAEELGAAGLAVERWTVAAEPTVREAVAAVAGARERAIDVVVGLGGGSAIDAGKAVAALLANPGDPYDYLEVVGRGLPLPCAPLPFVAVPTTAGTGAEVTRNAVLLAEPADVKVSLRSPLMLPSVALVDPALGVGVPKAVTASTGLDALTQLIEPFVSRRANPLTDSVCRQALGGAVGALRRAYHDGSDLAAREGMAFASLCGGLALANAALGAVHGFAGPLGGMLRAPHGALCATLLPHVMAANVAALGVEDPSSPILARYDEVARLLTGEATAVAQDGIELVRSLCAELSVPTLSTLGLRPDALPGVVANAARSSSMKGNPVSLDPPALERILRAAM